MSASRVFILCPVDSHHDGCGSTPAPEHAVTHLRTPGSYLKLLCLVSARPRRFLGPVPPYSHDSAAHTCRAPHQAAPG